MSHKDDPIFDALAGLPPVAPDSEWETRLQARCRSAISKRVAVRQQRTRQRPGLAFISATAVLCTYLTAIFALAIRLAWH